MLGPLARFATRRPVVTIGIWAVLLLVSLGLVDRLLDSATTTEFRLSARYESEQAAALLEDRMRGPRQLAELVVVEHSSATVDDPAFRTKVESLTAEITALGPDVVTLEDHFYVSNNPVLVSRDRQTTIMAFVMTGAAQEATVEVGDIIHIVEEANGVDGFRVLIGGDASVAFESNDAGASRLGEGRTVRSPGSARHPARAPRRSGGHAAPAWPGRGGHSPRPGGCGRHRPAVPAGLLRYVDGGDDRPGGRHRLLAPGRLALQGGDGARAGGA